MAAAIKLLAIAGYSGSGKTTLLEQLIPRLQKHNLKLGVIKHAHHDLQIDQPGKDSYRLRQAGAIQTMVACDQRWALMQETAQPTSLSELASHFTAVDLILVEGFKQKAIPKILCHRQVTGKPLLIDELTLAVVSDQTHALTCPQFALDDYETIKQFILDWL